MFLLLFLQLSTLYRLFTPFNNQVVRYNRSMLTERLIKRSARSARKPTDASPSRWHHGPWWSNSYLLTPLISILVFLIVMSLILWSLNRREQQQQEDTL